MKNSRTYPSRYSPDALISAGQYITELICEKKAATTGTELPIYFWKQDKWASFYRQQIITANGLLRLYRADAIIRALQSPQAFRIFSLRAPHLDGIIKGEQARLEAEEIVRNNSTIKLVEAPEGSMPRPPRITKNATSKLKELDSG